MNILPFINSENIFDEEVLMNKHNQHLYEFHFKLDLEMKNRLKGVAMFKNTRSLSGLIVRILKWLSPRIEKEHIFGKQRMSMYKFVNDDMDIKRESVHVYLPDYLYRKLKLMHQDLNFYSMAQLLRFILGIFLDVTEKYGNKIIYKLKRILKHWKAKKKNRKYKYKSIRQLMHFLYQNPVNSNFFTIYSNKFAPISIFRL